MSCPSSFNGVISELPFIRIDNFEVNKFNPKTIKAYFLSHYHTDHIAGFFSADFLKYLLLTKSYIYCTELTATFIRNDVGNESLLEFIKPLKMGSTLLTIQSENTTLYLTVTLIPAGHCAGSTMFLFKTIEKTVLYTGDFRMNTSDLHKFKALHLNGKPIKLDALYIDTTFLDKRHENFPKRSASVDEMIVCLLDWLSTDDNMVALRTSAKYGYEHVFNEIYKNLGFKVYVDDEKWKLYSKIQHLVPGVTNSKEETRIHLCYNCRLNEHYDKKIYFLTIKLSAWKWWHFDPNSDKACTDVEKEESRKKTMSVCYATHCSAQELMYFKNYLSPTKVVGFPGPFINYNFKKPDKSENKKVDKNVLRTLLD